MLIKILQVVVGGLVGSIAGAFGLTLLGFLLWFISDAIEHYRDPDFSTDGQTAMFVFVTLPWGAIVGFLMGAVFVGMRF